MKQQSLKKYPISIQTLEKVIERNYLYIDKMDYIYWTVHDASNYLSSVLYLIQWRNSLRYQIQAADKN